MQQSKYIPVHCICIDESIFEAVAKNGSFGFAKGWLVWRAKPNVPFVCRLNFIFFCAVGEK